MKITHTNAIQPASLQYNRNNGSNINYDKSSQKQIDELPLSYKPMIGFTGAKGQVTKSIRTQLLKLEDVHCPVCGVPTISKDSFQAVINRASQAANLKEYIEILNQNAIHFPKNALPVIKTMNDLYNSTPDKTITDAIAFARNGANRLIRKSFHESAEYIQYKVLENNFSNEDIEKLDRLALSLKSYTGKKLPKYNDFKNNLKNTFNSLETENKWDMYTFIRNNIVKEYNYLGFLKSDTSQMKELNDGAYLVKNILENSTSVVNPAFTNANTVQKGNNILMCTHCAGKKPNSFKFYVTQKPDIDTNIRLYLQDIGNALTENKLEGNELYIPAILKTFNYTCTEKEVFTIKDVIKAE